MKFQLSDVLDIDTGLNALSDLSKDASVRSSISFSIRLKTSRGLKAIKNEIEAYNETNKELLEKYGIENEEKPGNFKLGSNAKIYNEEIKKLLVDEASVPALTKSHFKLSDFRNIPISVDDMLNLDLITEDDVDEDGKRKVVPKKPSKK